MPKFLHLLPEAIDTKSKVHLQNVRLTLRRDEQILWWDVDEQAEEFWKSKCSFQANALNFITISERAGAQSKSFHLIAKLLIGSSFFRLAVNSTFPFRQQREIDLDRRLRRSRLRFLVDVFSSDVVLRHSADHVSRMAVRRSRRTFVRRSLSRSRIRRIGIGRRIIRASALFTSIAGNFNSNDANEKQRTFSSELRRRRRRKKILFCSSNRSSKEFC